MKKNKLQVVKAKDLLGRDRFSVDDDFYNLLIKDLNSVLKEYFEFRNLPIVDMVKNNGELNVTITLKAYNIKNFKALSKT
ncbi:MAG: hypothetical protein IJZ73_05990 [Clostridia bacterium]|nr:hypothetical protein [Clostridia bacterium]